MRESHDVAKHVIDAVSAFFALGALLKWLPAVASIFTIIWYAIRIYESVTVQKLLKRHGSEEL